MCMYKNYSSRIAYITYKESASTFSQTGDRRRWKWRMEAAVATATLGIWDEEGCSKSILQEWQLRSRTVFRTAFVPSQNPNPETLVVAASSDGSIATLSVFGKNKHEIISTCEDRKYPATFLALMALPFSKAVSGLYVALYWRSHVVSFGTQGLCIWLTRIPYWYKPECKNEVISLESAIW
ncbi:uncharacterized protein LOC135585896 isoform X3 [Musa acuminata AAA Group]|uniref:uncharacterized protein LOC135585896 isoform X3 n=1 Tax=Musa acuminata AAA Group TaxID=214697 RepID=UPI0031D0E57A